MTLKKISLNPKLTAFLDLIVNLILILIIIKISSWMLFIIIFLTRQFLWGLFIRLTYYPKEKLRLKHYLSLLAFSTGLYLTLIFIDWTVAFYILIIIFLALVFISFWFLPGSKIQLNIFLKPYTRWRFVLSSLGLAGIFIGLQSMMFYQISYYINNWVWYICSAIVSTAIAAWWWYEYRIKLNTKFYITTGIFLILMTELIWVISKLPIGNIVGGLLLAWSWYIIWLLNRFNLTVEGIKWKKQIKFLIINLSLLAIFLIFIVRWK